MRGPITVLLALSSVAIALPHASRNTTSCKCLPGDACWPSASEWQTFNASVDGNLIATVPLGSPCHDPSYSAAECTQLKSTWDYPRVHIEDPSSIMMPIFQNYTCDPFQPESKACTLGNLAVMSVNATKPEHVQSAVKFAASRNIRLSIKATGHDFLGRSSGTGSLGVWVHHLHGVTISDSYSSTSYSGPAATLMAGTEAAEAYEVVHAAGCRVVGGTCPTVCLAGGYTQGGGHGLLTSTEGLGADSVLEWTLVTANGNIVTASREVNSDLFWALSGGGGGNLGVVISMTTKITPETQTAGAVLAFNMTTFDAFWNAVEAFQKGIAPFTDQGGVVLAAVSNSTFAATFTAPSTDVSALQDQTAFMTDYLDANNIAYTTSSQVDATYFDHVSRYYGPLPDGAYPTTHLMGSRLIPRKLYQNNTASTALKELSQQITKDNEFYLSLVVANAGRAVDNATIAANAVHPAWRTALIHYTVYSPWDWSSQATMTQRSQRLAYEISPALEQLTPCSGTYANEAHYLQQNWQHQFYGPTWTRLNGVKDKWDPNHVFYAPLSPGAQSWEQRANGQLCRTA